MPLPTYCAAARTGNSFELLIGIPFTLFCPEERLRQFCFHVLFVFEFGESVWDGTDRQTDRQTGGRARPVIVSC